MSTVGEVITSKGGDDGIDVFGMIYLGLKLEDIVK